jgi:peptidoglycan/LPS O-acetylase OafA/YrhL
MAGWRVQNPAPVPPGTHLPVLDELKGWAMVLVIAYHASGVLEISNWLHGEVGVDLFLMISGFTLVHTARSMPWRQFLRRRLLRIFPSYWVALVLFVVLSAVCFEVQRSADNLIVHALGIHAFYSFQYFADINDSFWFISLIIAAYGVFLAVRGRLADIGWILGLGLLLFTATCAIYLQLNASGAIGHLGIRIPSFFAGLIAGQVAGGTPTELRFSPTLAVGLVATACFGFRTNIMPFYTLAAIAFAAAFLLVRPSLQRHPDGRFLLAGLGLLGTYSYEVFLFHQPLIRDYNRLAWKEVLGVSDPSLWQLVAGVAVGLAVTGLIAVVVHHAIGRLFRRRAS